MSGDQTRTKEALIPNWAAPAYLATALITLTVYWLITIASLDLIGLPVIKALGIVMLGFYALLRGAPVLAIALLLSSGGDFALALDPPAVERGIILFGAAHILYLSILVGMIFRYGARLDGVILAAALIGFALAMLWWLRPGMGALAVPATLYNALIVLMAIAAGFVKGSRLIVLGALLFVISDALLAAGWFADVRPLAPLAPVWITYAAAQVCLTLGLTRGQGDASARAPG